MSINPRDFRQFVIGPALAALEPAGIPATMAAADLLMATAAIETDLGTWLSQVGGPALGVFQIEPASLDDLIGKSITGRQSLAIASIMGGPISGIAGQIEGNMILAAAVCRLFYWHKPFVMPEAWTLDAMWGIYRQWYNTPLGAAQMADFVTALKLTDLAF